MDNPMISIIVPVYNVEQYLSQCIDSILSQSFSDFELILVDDGSPDSSGSICDMYAKKDSRVRVLHKKNQGVGAARNDGIAMAAGQWIMFVDSDDYADVDMLKKMHENCAEVDCVLSGLRYCYEETGQTEDKSLDASTFSLSQIDTQYQSLGNAHGFHAIYAKLYRKDIIDRFNIRFLTTYSILEDATFVSDYLSKCTCCTTMAEVFYNYRQTAGMSLVKRFNANAIDALAAKVQADQWMLPLLSAENLLHYYSSAYAQLWHFTTQIYRSAKLRPTERKRLLKQYVEHDVTQKITAAVIATALPKKRKLMVRLMNKKAYGVLNLILRLQFRI